MVPPIVQRKVVVGSGDPVGLHLRPAQQFVQLASRFSCEVEVVRDSLRVDGKSILHMMTLAAEPGAELVIEAGGPDAQAAVDALARFVENDFVIDETMSPSSAE